MPRAGDAACAAPPVVLTSRSGACGGECSATVRPWLAGRSGTRTRCGLIDVVWIRRVGRPPGAASRPRRTAWSAAARRSRLVGSPQSFSPLVCTIAPYHMSRCSPSEVARALESYTVHATEQPASRVKWRAASESHPSLRSLIISYTRVRAVCSDAPHRPHPQQPETAPDALRTQRASSPGACRSDSDDTGSVHNHTQTDNRTPRRGARPARESI
jgi:hypothetical protein